MKWIDITLPVSQEYPCWPGDSPYLHEVTEKIGMNGAECNLSRVTMSTHFGTHVDAPYHFLESGKTVDELDLQTLMGACQVVWVKGQSMIRVEHVRPLIKQGTKRLLIRTDNSDGRFDGEFNKHFVGISYDCAQYLVEIGIKLLGLDYYSIAPFNDAASAIHVAFLRSNDTVALEGINLSGIEPGEYELVCLPMKICRASGAPARVLLGMK